MLIQKSCETRPAKYWIFFCLSILFVILPVATNAEVATNYGLNNVGNAVLEESGPMDVNMVVGWVIQVILTFVGSAFFILVVYGGFIWMLARGREDEVKKAKKMIIDATIGLVLVFAAYALTYYIVDKALNVAYKNNMVQQ